jgi:Tol biopolymer transport system component
VKVVVLLGLAGCSQILGLEAPHGADATVVDSGTDASDAAAGSCMARWHAGTERFAPPTLVGGLASPSYDRDPFLSDDERTIYWSSDRGVGGTGTDIWTATRTAVDADFSGLQDVMAVSSIAGDTKASLTSDGLTMVLSSGRANGAGLDDLWVTHRNGLSDAWATPTENGLMQVDDASAQLDPVLSRDGTKLYYSVVSGGGTPQRIDVALRNGPLMAYGPGAVVAGIGSSSAFDADPALAADESFLLFASTRQSTSNAPHLWVALASSQGFDVPQVVPDVGSSAGDGDPWLSLDGCRLYFSSNRSGNFELYVSSMSSL